MKILLALVLFLQVLCGYSQQQANSSGKSAMAANENIGTADASATPVYPGGNRALLAFISKNIKYPEMAREEKTQGQVTVRFLVDVDGTVKNAMVPKGKGIGNGCDEEAIRVLMSSPKWKPAIKDGSPTAVWYEVPILFALAPAK